MLGFLRQDRWIFALIPFCIAIGIPAALGLIPANLLLVLGAVLGCVLARTHLRGGVENRTVLAIAVVCWAVCVPYLRFRTIDIGSMLAAHSVFGSSVLLRPGSGAAVSIAAFIVGLGACVIWLREIPILGGVDRILRKGEAVLLATIVATSAWGSPVLARGLDQAAISALAVVASCAAVWYASTWKRPA
ncbi:MAG: hypothetical protein ABIS18_06835 [Actinomycetota bacterium]